MKRRAIFFAAFILLLGGLGASSEAAKTQFLLDWIVYGKHAPFFAAQDMGFFKKVGLDVEYKRGFGSGDTIVKIGAKAAPLGFADASSLVNARANSDVKVKIVAMNHAKAMSVVVFLKEKGYKTPKDLVGARYGTPLASSTAVIFPALAGANGFDSKDVKWIEMPYAASIPSLLAGRVDFITLFTTELPTLLPKAAALGKEVKMLYYSDWGVDTYNNGVIVHDDTIKAEPNFVRNAVKAYTDAWAWSLVHVDEAVKNFLKYAPGMSEPIIRGHLTVAIEHLFDDGVRQHGLGYTDHKKMDYTVDILTRLQKLKKRVPTEEMYTNRFLPQWPAIKAALGDKAM
ncbi:MAG: ABC transporter substrate-binding protein [Candidatus Tectomicrobia bacterium]|nr:ABC transporter substrate-binding protein [Candidatus Tectomicrobia bacterium]